MKRNTVLTQVPTWTNLEHIILSDTSQTQKDKYCDSTSVKYLDSTT